MQSSIDHQHQHQDRSSGATAPDTQILIEPTDVITEFELDRSAPIHSTVVVPCIMSKEDSESGSAKETCTKIPGNTSIADITSHTNASDIRTALEEESMISSTDPEVDRGTSRSAASIHYSSVETQDSTDEVERAENPSIVPKEATSDNSPIKQSEGDMDSMDNSHYKLSDGSQKSETPKTVLVFNEDDPKTKVTEEQSVKAEDNLSAATKFETLADAQETQAEMAKNRQDDEEEEEEVVIRPRSRSKRSALPSHGEEHASTTKKARRESPTASSAFIENQQMKNDQPQSNDDDDEEGNTKVDEHGALIGDRTYTSKAFQLPMRGDTYYFLATEIARVSGYRDSYLLFNKNRNLKKLMTTEAEKVFLIQQELIPYSYRNRQIGVVKALSIYKTFGARVIEKGMRVKDDYFAQRARDLGFTEEDYANEDDRPVEDKLHAQAEAQRRADTDADIALANSAKSTVDYNAMINEERLKRVSARRQHFNMVMAPRIGRMA